MNNFDDDFWKILDSLINDSEIVIDRPKGTIHPKGWIWQETSRCYNVYC